MSELLPEQDPAFWLAGTFALRAGEAVIAALPDLVAGLVIAGLLRHYLGDDRLRRWFARWPTVALAAIALPVGPAGILPVGAMLHRAGVRTGALAAIVLLGGAVGPLSLAYLMERATPLTALVLVAMLFASAWLLHTLTGRREPDRPSIGDDAPGLLPALAEARPLLQTTWLPLCVGITAFALLAAFLPAAFLGHAMAEPEPMHAVASVVVPLIGFYPPEIGALFTAEAAAGVYPGAAWATLLGGGVTLGTLVLLATLLKRRHALIAIALAGGLVLTGVAALQLTPPLIPPAAEDSHAFDRLSRPFHLVEPDTGAVVSISRDWSRAAGTSTLAAAILLLGLVLLPSRQSGRTVHLSPTVLRGLGVVGIVAWGVLTIGIYFPSATVVLDQMRHPEGELSAALADGDAASARRALDRIDRLAFRGRIGSTLRLDRTAAQGMVTITAAVDEARPRLDTDLTYRDGVPVFQAAGEARSDE
jgi:hypothetical protein